MRKLICVALVCSLMALGAAQGQSNEQEKQNDREFAAYEAAGEIGTEIFIEAFKRDRPLVRAIAVLEACEQMGLAKALREKDTDRKFDIEFKKMVSEGRFDNRPFSTVLMAQSVATGLRTGYEIGYRDASQLAQSDPRYKANLCAAAVKGANDLLK